jgi:uncharacterized membrane protein
MVEIIFLVINLIYLIFVEYTMWQHDIGHYKLVTSCMIIACVIQSTNEKYNQFKYISHPLFM